MCTDSGAYMANLKCCTVCSSNKLGVSNKTVTEVDEVETVVFERKKTCFKIPNIGLY